MSKKDYEFFALLFKRFNLIEKKPQLVQIVAEYFEKQNERFDKERFFKACK